jgi:hypothetical protein
MKKIKEDRGGSNENNSIFVGEYIYNDWLCHDEGTC